MACPDHPAVKAILSGTRKPSPTPNSTSASLPSPSRPTEIRAACTAVQAAGYNFFEDMTAVDWFPRSPRFQLSYHILSHQFKERIRLRVLLGEAESVTVDSITPSGPAANFYEREVFDLFGIRFAGHPDLRRIMLPDDWKGHPLRKDYPVEGYR